MSTNQPPSFRFPFQMPESIHPTVRAAARYLFSGLVDAQNAITALNTKVNAIPPPAPPAPAPAASPTPGGSNNQTIPLGATTGPTSYITGASDFGGLILTDGGTVTLSSGVPNKFYTRIYNTGTSGAATVVSPDGVSGQTVNNAANYSVAPGASQTFWLNNEDSNWSAA